MDILKRNNVTISGSGKQAMVFAHGFGCDQRMWRLVAPAFEADYQVVLLDLVGAGQSDLTAYDPEHYSTLAAHADDILRVLHELGLHDVIFVGHSVSSMIGVLAALKEPTLFSRLVLVAPSPRYINDGSYVGGFDQADIDELLEAMDNNYLGWSGNITPVIMGNPDRPELTNELNQSFCSTNPTIARHFARVTFLSDNRSDLSQLRIPTLLLQCAQDIIAPLSVGEFMRKQIPNSQLVVLNTSGHCPHLSAPEATVAAMHEFLEVPAPVL